jgi:hypothetical protein
MQETRAVKISFSLQDWVRPGGRDHVSGARVTGRSVWVVFVQVIAAGVRALRRSLPRVPLSLLRCSSGA